MSNRHAPLLVAVFVVLAATGVVSTLRPAINPSQLPSGLAVSMNAESTALYCTGLARASHAPSLVTFYNTLGVSRHLSVSVVSNLGSSYFTSLELAGHAAQSIEPARLVRGNNFAVAVQISGGGVVGEEIAGTRTAEVPCAASGVTRWYAGGLNTTVGSSAYISVYNPTATAAVFNVTVSTGAGFAAPQSFQGVSVPAHTQSEINLGSQIINSTNVGVAVRVLRGTLVLVGIQDSDGVVSYEAGLTGASRTSWFPDVTTARFATAQVRVANPFSTSSEVTVSIALGAYHVAPVTLAVAPFSTGLVTITPNPAVPVAGYATLSVHSSQPVVSTLATGTGSWITLSSPERPENAFLVRNFTGRGFDEATVTNTASRATTLTISSLHDSTRHAIVVDRVTLAARTTRSLVSIVPALARARNLSLIVASQRPSLVVTLTLPSSPPGVDVVAPLNGR